MNQAMIAMTPTPPMTPPAMAPFLDFEGLGCPTSLDEEGRGTVVDEDEMRPEDEIQDLLSDNFTIPRGEVPPFRP